MTTSNHAGPGFRIVVFTCGDLGLEVGAGIQALPSADEVLVLRSPYLRRKRRMDRKLLYVYRMNGAGELMRAALRRILPRRPAAPAPAVPPAGLTVRDVTDLHSTESIEAIRRFSPDLGVIAGTYILKPEIFALPPLGSINLHSGKVPEYRGAAPAFWELFNGETEVGITIHRVEPSLDSGAVLRQECFPLDPAPEGDPMAYVAEYRRTVLHPNGVRMLVETVADIMAGRERASIQDATRARTYRTPNHRQVMELRRRVAMRRRARGGNSR